MKIKTWIRRILFLPIWIVILPFAWLFTGEKIKDIWEEVFLELTDEETDDQGGLM